MIDLKDYQLGSSSEEIKLETSEDNQQVALELVEQARRSLIIFSHDLEPKLYDTDSFAKALTQLAIYSRYTTIQILFRDCSHIVKHGHRLIEVARRLTSSIEIRETHHDYRNLTEAYLVADSRGVLYRRIGSRYDGSANFNDPHQGRELQQRFNEIWEKSQPHPELRRLHL